MSKIHYKYHEEETLAEIKAYVDDTYKEHYAGAIQPMELAIDKGHGIGFCVGAIIKYAARFGRKSGYNRKDILKMIHYGMILLHTNDHAPKVPDAAVHPEVQRLVRERDAALEYLRHFSNKLGVKHSTSTANHAEVALCKLDALLNERAGLDNSRSPS